MNTQERLLLVLLQEIYDLKWQLLVNPMVCERTLELAGEPPESIRASLEKMTQDAKRICLADTKAKIQQTSIGDLPPGFWDSFEKN